MKKAISLVLAVLMVLSLAACGAKTEAPAASAPEAAAPEAAGTIKIGYVSDLTGATSLWGTAGMYGAQQAVKEINEAGGVLGGQMLELVTADGKGEPADSVSGFQNMVQQGIVASIGTNFSSCNIPMADVADQVKVPIIGTAASNELVTVAEDGTLHPYSFRMCFIDSYLGTVIGNYAYNNLGITKAALFTISGDTNSESVGAFVKEAFVANGGEVAVEEQCQAGDLDFRAQLANIKAAEVEAIFVVMNNYSMTANFAIQARELGIEAQLMGHDGWDSSELAGAAEGALEGGIYFTRIGFNDPKAKALGELIMANYPMESMEAECLFGYDGVMWVVDAIERAGSAEPTAIRDALEATEVFEGMIGTLVMNAETHNPSMACAAYNCEGDKFVYVEVVEAQ